MSQSAIPGDVSIEMSRFWERVWAHRRGVAVLTVAGTLLVAVVAFLLPPWYRAQVSLLPPTEEEAGFSMANLFRGIGVPGVRIPSQAAPAEVFEAILSSRRINEEVVRRFDLKRLYRKKLTEDAVKELRRHTKVKLTRAGTVELSVEDRDPERAAAMASAFIEALDHFNRDVRMTKGRRTRQFVEARLLETKTELAAAEDSLSEYQSTHKAAVLSPEVTSAIETAARLYAQRAALQVRLGVIHSYTRSSSDDEVQIAQQLAQLDSQLSALPETGLELARRLRDVKTLEGLYVLLTSQYEEARINEVRDLATVEVLDPSSVPERKARPRRSIMTATALLVSLAVGVAWALSRDEKSPPDPPLGGRTG